MGRLQGPLSPGAARKTGHRTGPMEGAGCLTVHWYSWEADAAGLCGGCSALLLRNAPVPISLAGGPQSRHVRTFFARQRCPATPPFRSTCVANPGSCRVVPCGRRGPSPSGGLYIGACEWLRSGRHAPRCRQRDSSGMRCRRLTRSRGSPRAKICLLVFLSARSVGICQVRCHLGSGVQ